MLRLSLACLALLCAAAPALPQDAADKLQGSAYKDEEACAKGLNSEGCILSFFIEGKAARTLFDGMTEKAQREECTGGMQKFNENGLACFKYDDGTYQCSFGYHFKEKKFGGSHEDC
jgi:hypothetical protein